MPALMTEVLGGATPGRVREDLGAESEAASMDADLLSSTASVMTARAASTAARRAHHRVGVKRY